MAATSSEGNAGQPAIYAPSGKATTVGNIARPKPNPRTVSTRRTPAGGIVITDTRRPAAPTAPTRTLVGNFGRPGPMPTLTNIAQARTVHAVGRGPIPYETTSPASNYLITNPYGAPTASGVPKYSAAVLGRSSLSVSRPTTLGQAATPVSRSIGGGGVATPVLSLGGIPTGGGVANPLGPSGTVTSSPFPGDTTASGHSFLLLLLLGAGAVAILYYMRKRKRGR